MESNNLKINFLACLFLIFLSFSCTPPVEENSSESEDISIQSLKETPNCSQILYVFTENKEAVEGKLFGTEFRDGQWATVFDTIDCSVGKNGFADIDKKFEGDGKSPSGKFPIGAAFGYQKDIESEVEFIELKDNHYWVSDTASGLYNQLIEYNPKDRFSEKMRRSDHLYKYGIIIEYNTQDIQKGKGSAIFMHIERRKGAPTAGCVAISEDNIRRLIQWIKPEKNPVIIMGTKEIIGTFEL